jgi:hypothetical protein
MIFFCRLVSSYYLTQELVHARLHLLFRVAEWKGVVRICVDAGKSLYSMNLLRARS